MKRRRRRQLKIAGIITVIFALSAGSLWYYFDARANDVKMSPDQMGIDDNTLRKDGIVKATGMTQIGKEPVIFAIDFLENTSLYVEDVYLSNGGSVVAGEKCIKFTQDSLDKTRTELERAVQRAELAYRSKVISNDEESMQAKYVYDTALLEAEYAYQVYQDTLAQLEMQLARAEKVYMEAQEEYNAYDFAVKNNTFYEDYKIEELKKAYEDAYDLCTQRGEYWEVTEEELSALSQGGKHALAGSDDRQWIIETVALLREEALEAKAEYEQAQQDYQQEIGGARLKLQKLLNQFEQAEQNLTDAQIKLQEGSLRAKTVYELTMAKGQMASNDYNVCMMDLSNELERQKDVMSEAVENRELFEQMVGDGYLYAERAGTVAMVSVEKGQSLAGGDQIFVYGNPSEMYVYAAVPAEDIAMLYVGEDACVAIADRYYRGAIRTIRSMVTSQGEDSIYSMVAVALGDDASMIEPNMTAMVVFGVEDGTAYKAVMSNLALQMYDADLSLETDDGNAEYLTVGEIYVEPGQNIRKGDPVCQFAQDSIENVRKMLTYAQSKAQMALMEAQAKYHIGVLEAGLTHNESLTNASLAQTVYDNTIASLNSGMEAKTLEIEQLLADIYQLQLSLTDDAYVERRADITKAYEQARRQVEKTREDFVSSQVETVQAFQAAKEAYEDFFSQSEGSNQQIADKIEEIGTIQNELLRSQQLLERELMTAEQTRISSQTKGEIANATYAGRVKAYESVVSKAQSDLDQAVRKLDDFNKFVGDGIIYAAGDGIVAAVGYEKGDLLVDVGKLVSYVAAADMVGLTEGAQEEGDAQ